MTDHTRSETSADGGLTERTEATAATARDQAATVAHTAQSQLAEVKDEAAAQAQGVVQDAKVQARRRPGMFLLGALGAGLVVGRLVKAADTHGIVDAAKGAVTGEDGPTPTNGSHSSASPAMGGPAGAPSTSTTSPAPTAPTFQSTSSDPQWAVRP